VTGGGAPPTPKFGGLNEFGADNSISLATSLAAAAFRAASSSSCVVVVTALLSPLAGPSNRAFGSAEGERRASGSGLKLPSVPVVGFVSGSSLWLAGNAAS
jgi:hypothetical protein